MLSNKPALVAVKIETWSVRAETSVGVLNSVHASGRMPTAITAARIRSPASCGFQSDHHAVRLVLYARNERANSTRTNAATTNGNSRAAI